MLPLRKEARGIKAEKRVSICFGRKIFVGGTFEGRRP